MSEPFARPDAPMCAILIDYVAALDAVDRHMAAHVAWLAKGYEAGMFVMSGRRQPRTGGVILTRGHAAEVEALAASDPFVVAGVATTTVIAFTASMSAPAIADLLR